jgi:hypothetical protein
MADVLAACTHIAKALKLDNDRIEKRWAHKCELFEKWSNE